MNYVGPFLCFGLFVVAIAATVVAVLFRQRMAENVSKIDRLAEELAETRARLAKVERQAGTPAAPAPAPPPAQPARSVRAEVPVEAAAVTSTLPPPLPPEPMRSPLGAAPPPGPHERAPTAAAEASQPFSLERFLGGRVLLAIGVVSVLVGAGFFLKLAIDRDWIGPAARIVLGVLVGGAAIAGGDVVVRRGYRHYGASLMGGGIGLLYLCDYFASVRYGMWDRPAAFAIAGAVTGAACYLALRRDASPLAWLGFVGALAAPAFLGRGEDALGGLTIWLAFVSLGIGALLMRRDWRGLEVMAVVGNAVYFVGWSERFSGMGREGLVSVCLFVLAALPATVAVGAAAWRRSAVPATAHVAVGLGAILGVVAGSNLLYTTSRTSLGVGVLLGAALVGGLAALVRARCETAARDASALLASALALAAIAGLFLLRGNAVAPAFALCGAALVIAVARRSRVAGAAGWGFIGIAAIDVLTEHLPLRGDGPSLVNAEFLVALTPCVGAFVAAWPRSESAADAAARPWSSATAIVRALAIGGATSLIVHDAARAASHGLAGDARRAAEVAGGAFAAAGCAVATAALMRVRSRFSTLQTLPVGPFIIAAVMGLIAAGADVRRDYQPFPGPLFLGSVACATSLLIAAALGILRSVAGPVAAGVFLVAISCRIHAWGVHEGDWLLGQMWMSGAWAIYAAALLVTGFWRQIRPARWAGIGLFLATAAKVLLIDLSRLDTPARVGSFLVLGVLLVGASFLYQRLTREPPAS